MKKNTKEKRRLNCKKTDMRNCANCQKDLSLAKLTNYEIERDLLICVQCYLPQKEKYLGYSVNHFPLLKRSGEVDGSTEALIVWNYQK